MPGSLFSAAGQNHFTEGGMSLQQDEHIQKVILHILKEPDDLGRRVGFKDLTSLHREWIREMIDGEGDYTLQAHRGSYKSSCLAVAIAILMILKPKRNIIFLRKTDSDVAEMLGMVSKILRT